MSSLSINSANVSGVHLNVNRTWSSPTTANIFARTLKQRASPHCNFSVTSGNERQYSRISSTFIPSLSFQGIVQSVSRLKQWPVRQRRRQREISNLFAEFAPEPVDLRRTHRGRIAPTNGRCHKGQDPVSTLLSGLCAHPQEKNLLLFLGLVQVLLLRQRQVLP